MSTFSQQQLITIKSINIAYQPGTQQNPVAEEKGIEMSNYRAVSNPGTTNAQNANAAVQVGGGGGFIDMQGYRYSGAVLFDTLYGTNYSDKSGISFGWKTGWTTNASPAATDTFKSRVKFGIIPIIWSNCKNNAEGDHIIYDNSDSGYKQDGKFEGSSLQNFAKTYFGSNQQVVSAIPFDIDYYKVLGGQSDIDDTGKSTPKKSEKEFELLTINNAIGLGLDKNYPNSWKGCNLTKTTYNVVNHRYDSSYEWWKIEKPSFNWLPDEMSYLLRLGAIVTHDAHKNITYEPAYGYYRFRNNDGNGTTNGISDTGVFEIEEEVGGAPIKTTWAAHCLSNPAVAENDYLFGCTTEYVSGSPISVTADHTFNSLLNKMYTERYGGILRSTSKRYNNTLKMYHYSTVPFITGNGTVLNIVPVFAMKVADTDTVSQHCNIINTFQSIVYSTLHIPSKNPYSGSDVDLAAGETIDYNPIGNNVPPYNQIKPALIGTYCKYQDFIMKETDPKNIYLSYALKVKSDKNGNPMGIEEGKTLAGENDWIAWINGNIYVIPEDLFKKYVFYTVEDFNALDIANI